MSCIVVRYLLIYYRLQQANVRWRNEVSGFFPVSNGVKQGSVLSAVLCVYTNGVFENLRRQNIGCCIGPNFVGIIGYADDLFLMSPTLDGLQKMLRVCEHYAKDHNLRFSTNSNPKKSKTKCMAFLQEKRDLNKLKLCGDLLPWVVTGKHLGTTLKVLNFAGIKFRDFAIFSLNREIKYQGETFQVYNREIKYPRNLISGVF